MTPRFFAFSLCIFLFHLHGAFLIAKKNKVHDDCHFSIKSQNTLEVVWFIPNKTNPDYLNSHRIGQEPSIFWQNYTHPNIPTNNTFVIARNGQELHRINGVQLDNLSVRIKSNSSVQIQSDLYQEQKWPKSCNVICQGNCSYNLQDKEVDNLKEISEPNAGKRPWASIHYLIVLALLSAFIF